MLDPIRHALPTRNEIETTLHTFTFKQWLLFIISFVVLGISALVLLIQTNTRLQIGVPAEGGTTTEGIVGTPRFINPILALSDADRDLSMLVYSGLMRKSVSGDLIPDLAESYTISSDGLIYTFVIKADAMFQDGKPVLAADIVYTINEIKNSAVKSPKLVNWDGVDVVEKDAHTVVFTLKQRYASFLENTTIGILPAHLWQSLSPEQFSLSNLNIQPVGSGPFMISKVSRTSDGIPSSYQLTRFKKFVLGKPYLDSITFRFYANDNDLIDALNSGAVDAINSISSVEAKKLADKGYTVDTTPLPRVFALYFNQSQNTLFTDKNVMNAFELAISKKRIVDQVLNTYGISISSPLPVSLNSENLSGKQDTSIDTQDIEAAKNILIKDGWTQSDNGWIKKDAKTKKTTSLSFSLATSDAPELKDAATLIKEDLERLGVQVELKVFDIGSLNQNVIRPRKYEALFFGQVVNHDTDLFAFWHSSQRNDPGLNIAMYTNAKVDKYLEQANGTLDADKRQALFDQAASEIDRDKPAIFIYSPLFIYTSRNKVGGLSLNHITTASDRLTNAYEWYREQEHIWKIFVKQ